jgi:hypothetical protein
MKPEEKGMSFQIIKGGLLASLVLLLTSCSDSIFNSDNQSIEKQTIVTAKEVELIETNDNQGENQLVRILEQNLSYNTNQKMRQDTAYLKYNDNQNYSMYVLPDYEVIVEEPTIDLLYFTKNKAISMRIELLSDHIDWDSVRKSTYSELASLYKSIPIETYWADHHFEDLELHVVTIGEDLISTFLIHNSDMNLKLTMHTKTNEDHRDAFFQMAKTIMREE